MRAKYKLTKRERQDYVNRLKALQRITDTEGAHMDADNILAEILFKTGHDDIAEEYQRVRKWYA